MKTIIFFLGLLLTVLLSASFLAGQQPTQPLKNEDIVKMVKEGFSENLIIQTIERFPSNYDVSPNALIELKKQGVNMPILEAMSKASFNKALKTVAEKEETKETEEKKSFVHRDFIFEVSQCRGSGGDSLTCYFSINNKGRERQITISLDSYILDDAGGQVSAADVRIGNSSRTYRFETQVTNKIASQVSVAAVLKFENIKTKPKLLKLLRISCVSESESFNADFRDVPVSDITFNPRERTPQKTVIPIIKPTPQPKTENLPLLNSGRNVPVTENDLSVLPNEKTAADVFRIKYRRAPFIAVRSEQEDLCEGILTVNQTRVQLELTGGKSFHGKSCPVETYIAEKEKVLELKDSSKENVGNYLAGNLMFSDYVYLKIAFLGGKNKDKNKTKDFLLYPTDATVVLGTTQYNPLGNNVRHCGDCAAIVCKDCQTQLSEMKRSLAKIANLSIYRIGGEKFKSGKQ